MQIRNTFNTLLSDMEKLEKLEYHHLENEARFSTLKKEILKKMQTVFGETSRHYRIVKLTDSPSTVIKVMKHLATRTETLDNAVNL